MYQLSEADKAAFERDGVVCLRGVLTTDEVSALRSGVQTQFERLGTSQTGYDFEAIGRQIWGDDTAVDSGSATRFDMSNLKKNVRADKEATNLLEDDAHETDEGCFFYDVAAWKHHAGVRDVAFDSALPEIVRDLIDANYLNFWEDTTFVKAPGTRQRTAFHQDLAYFQIDGDQCVIVWIPLDAASTENGVTEYVRGSHKWGETYAPNVFVSQTPVADAIDKRCPNIEAHAEDYDIVSFEVEPGDVIIHHVLTVHGAGGNLSNRWRRAMSFRYCGDQVRYYDRPGAIQQVGVSHKLKNGDRLLSEDYPIVWPRPWPNAKLASFYTANVTSTDAEFVSGGA